MDRNLSQRKKQIMNATIIVNINEHYAVDEENQFPFELSKQTTYHVISFAPFYINLQ